MHACPSCGFANSEDATRCALCGRALAPAQRPEEPAITAASTAQQPETPAPVPPPPVYAQAQQPPEPNIQPPPAGPAPVTTPMQPPTMPSMPPYGAAPPPPYGAPPPYPMQPGMPPPPRPPLIMPRPQFTRAQWRNRYLLGLGLGFIPLLIVLVVIGIILNRGAPAALTNNAGYGLIAALVLYVAVFIGMIVCLAIERLRPIGYGLLTMVVAGPIIAAASCFGAIALASRPTG